jgi:hypothetical protein
VVFVVNEIKVTNARLSTKKPEDLKSKENYMAAKIRARSFLSPTLVLLAFIERAAAQLTRRCA